MTSTHTTIAQKLVGAEQAIDDLANKSWYDVCKETEEGKIMTDDSSANIRVKTQTDEISDKSNDSPTGNNDREILVSFLDSTNEEKYERLLKEEKIKTTFKRRLSPTSSDTSAGSNDKDHNSEQSSPRSSNNSPSTYGKRVREIETDESVLDRRQKQIDYGKNTIGYDFYIKQVPREKRTKEHPWTPRKDIKYSRRAFDGLVKGWRKKLHCYDPFNMRQIKSKSSEDV